MHSAIVVVETLDEFHQERWRAFIATIYQANKSAAVERLAENVWQVNFQASPSAFAKLVDGICQYHLRGKIFQFADEPQWLQVDSDPNTS